MLPLKTKAVTVEATDSSRPEPPPELERRIIVGPCQALGLLFLAALPVLALLGLLGDRPEILKARSGDLVLYVETSARARSGNLLQLKIQAEAPANHPARRLEITVSAGYLERFTAVQSRPPAERTTGRDPVFVQRLPPDAHGTSVTLDLTPARPGWARGLVHASLESGESVELPLKTLILP